MQKASVLIRYPQTMQPGENRFIYNGLEVNGVKGKIGVTIVCTDIEITSYNQKTMDQLLIKSDGREIVRGLHYAASRDIEIGTRKDIGVYVSTYRISLIRLIGLGIMTSLFLLPSLSVLVESASVGFAFTVSDSILLQIPFFILIGMVLTASRLKSIWSMLLNTKIETEVDFSSHGEFERIQIQKIHTDQIDNIYFSVQIPTNRFSFR